MVLNKSDAATTTVTDINGIHERGMTLHIAIVKKAI